MAVSIQICNLALLDVRAPPIADIGEDSAEAQACAVHYPQCLAVLLDRHSWSFGTKLASLAQLTDNERSSEWSHAYTLPTGLERAIRIMPSDTLGLSTRARYWPFPGGPEQSYWNSFEIEAGKLYSNLDSVTLEYSTTDFEGPMPAMFNEALRKSLAANLAIALPNSRELKGDLMREAEIATTRAIADDMNRQPNREALDDVAWVRQG